MLAESGLQEKLIHITKPNGDTYVVYGDLSYGWSYNILAPFRGAHLTVREKQIEQEWVKFAPVWVGKELPSGMHINQLSHMSIWVCNKQLF